MFARAMRWCVPCCALMLVAVNAASAQEPPAPQPMTPGGDIPRLRTETSRTFIGPDGSVVARVYPEAVNYRDERGRWQLIDNELEPDGTVLRNRAGEYALELPKDLSSGDVRVAHDGAWISFAPRGASALARAHDASARYRGAWPGVELRYKAGGDGVKEELVLSGPSAVRDFVFDIRLRFGLTPVMLHSGAIEIRDDATGDVPLKVQPSFMVDAAGVIEPVAARLRPSARGWSLVLAPDRRWLRDPARRWPVTIDPQVSAEGTEACEISIDTSFCSVGGELGIGYRTFNIEARTLLRFDVANALPAGAVVEHADLYVNHVDANMGTFEAMEAHEVTNAWSEPDWEYTGVGSWGSPGGDFVAEPLARFDTGESGLRGWDITDLTRDWADNLNANDGVILKVPDSTYSATTIAGVGETNGPRLEIQYAETDDPEGVVDQAAVETYQDEMTITETEALRRLQIQDRFNLLVEALEAAVPANVFAGLWFDDDDGKAKIGIKSATSPPPTSATEDAADILDEHDLTDDVDFVAVDDSLADLTDAYDDIDAELNGLLEEGGVATGIEISENTVTVETANSLTTTEEDAVDDAVSSAPVDVDVIETDDDDLSGVPTACTNRYANVAPFGVTISLPFLQCDRTWRGGTTLWVPQGGGIRPICTGGFGAYSRSDDKPYVLTAGHCVYGFPNFRATRSNDTVEVLGPSHSYAAFPLDAGLIRVTNNYWLPFQGYLFVGHGGEGGRNEWYPIKRIGQQAEDTKICTTSALPLVNVNNNTYTDIRSTCGTVRKIYQSNSQYRYQVLMTMCGPFSGSSGSPVYKGGTASGMISNVETPLSKCQTRFVRVGYAEDALNVTIAKVP